MRHKLRISTNFVPPELQTEANAKFIEREITKINNAFSIEGKLEAVCEHEAAHLVYIHQVNLKTQILGPSVYFQDGEFRHFLAGISIIDRSKIPYTVEILTGLARSGVAGTLTDDRLVEKHKHDLNVPLVADMICNREVVKQNDYETFKSHCFDAARYPHQVKPEWDNYWRAADAFVKDDLTGELTQQQIKDQSLIVMAELIQ